VINLEIGEFTFINPDQLRFVFKIAARGTLAEDAYLNITKTPGAIRCKNCGFEGKVTLEDNPEYHVLGTISLGLDCPKCKSRDTEIIGGRELNIKDIKIEE
ncbi:MAG: hydrogenase maturation nickel metallochaperone HypA/HybF, partial [Candidatus Helarchaeales archaeon]